ncbi:DASH complex subunit Dad3-domain-containing protein [Dipodascopsis uninucleata]
MSSSPDLLSDNSDSGLVIKNNIITSVGNTSSVSDALEKSLLSTTEQSLLKEYRLLNNNLQKLSEDLSRLSSVPTPEILDNLRVLERKTAVVLTLLKASVYSIFLQQQLHDEEGVLISEDGGIDQ